MAAAMGSQAEVGAAAYLPAALNDGQSLTLLRLLGFGPSVAARCRMIESLLGARGAVIALDGDADATCWAALRTVAALAGDTPLWRVNVPPSRSEEHTSELQSL